MVQYLLPIFHINTMFIIYLSSLHWKFSDTFYPGLMINYTLKVLDAKEKYTFLFSFFDTHRSMVAFFFFNYLLCDKIKEPRFLPVEWAAHKNIENYKRFLLLRKQCLSKKQLRIVITQLIITYCSCTEIKISKEFILFG